MNERSALPGQLFLSEEPEQLLSTFLAEDKDWLIPLAKAHDVAVTVVLLIGSNMRFETWDEDFTDEDTGESFTLTHAVPVEGRVFDLTSGERLLLGSLISEKEGWKDCDPEKKMAAYRLLRAYGGIDPTALLLMFAEEHGMTMAYEELGELYRYGDESIGVFVNREKAKAYYSLAGIDYDPAEDEEDDDPQEYTYILTGNADTLDNIKPLIDSLCRRFGSPDDELGLFVPLGAFMRVLVGTSDYRGNILRVEKPSPECLVLHVEADNGAPLLYALRQCFPDIKVEMKRECL